MKLRTILFVLAALTFFSAATGGYLYYSSLRQSALVEAERHNRAHAIRANKVVSSFLSHNLKPVAALAGLDEIRQAIEKPNADTMAPANALIDHFQRTLGADVCYLMDYAGETLAASNRHTPESFVGKNYAFRPYFQKAMQGLPTVYMALGVTSNRRGVYFSQPIYLDTQERPAGVVVLKASVEPLEQELTEEHNTEAVITLVTDSNGVIFMSNYKAWLFHTIWRVSDKDISDILQTRQFGKSSLRWTGLESKNQNLATLNGGAGYFIHREAIGGYPGWSVYNLTAMQSIFEGIHNPLIKTAGSIAILLGAFVGISVFVLYKMASSDIRQRKMAEDALKASEANYRSIFNAANDAIFVHDAETGKILDVNQKMCEMFGYTLEEANGLSVEDVSSGVPPYTQKDALKWITKAIDGRPQLFEWRAKDRSGELFWVEVNLKRTTIGEENRVLAVVRDISERKRTDKELRKSEQRHQAISELTSDYAYAFRVEPDGTLVNDWVTGALQRITGFTKEEIQSRGGWESLIYPDDISIPLAQLKALQNNQSKVVEYRIIAKNGDIRWMRDYARPGRENGSGRLIHIFGAVQDITEQKQMEATLRESELKYKNLFNNAQVGLGRARIHDGKVLESNAKLAQIFGYNNRQEFIDEFVFSENYVDPALREKMLTKVEKTGVVNDMIAKFYRKDGTIVWARFDSQIFPEAGYMEDVVVDITEQKMAEDEKNALESKLRQAQKMEAIGTLAGGIAHDFNNILSALIGYTELSLAEVEKETVLHKNLQEILGAGLRAKDLVKQILTFSRQAELELKPVQVKPILKEGLKFLRASLPTTIEIRPSIQSDSLVTADPTQIHQVLMNLCTNAAHAMAEKGGVLAVKLVDVEIDADLKAEHPELKPGNYLELIVSDTGHGMPAHVLERIFDPFFTTKGTGEGTGMGLAVVHGIVGGCGGAITADSEPGKGSTFKVYLPVVGRQSPTLDPAKESMAKGTERILFVDDEPALVKIGKKMLESLGYTVTGRTSSLEALELFKAKPERFDLVITDMAMPNMSGDILSAELMKVRPEIPIILCTGYSAKISEESALKKGIKAFAYKPVGRHDLADSVRRVLDEAQINS